jgi:tripartite-type tricarboxylate transporter receptor subunit TctC
LAALTLGGIVVFYQSGSFKNEVVAKLSQQGAAPAGGTPEEFDAFVASEIKRWTAAARANKITLPQ